MSDDLVRRLVGKTWYVTDSTGKRWADDAPEDAARALLAKDAENARLAEMLIESASWLEGTGNSGPMGYAKTIRAALEGAKP